MARDIEEFLRKAAQKRNRQQQQRRQPAQPPPRQQQQRQVKRTAPVDDVEVVEDIEVVAPRRTLVQRDTPTARQQQLRKQSVSEHVQQHINTQDIAEHTSHLGERIQYADDRIAARIKQHLDHDVSKLDDLPTVQDDVVASVKQDQASQMAQDLLEMFRNPDSVRQAILVSEILNRPSFD